MQTDDLREQLVRHPCLQPPADMDELAVHPEDHTTTMPLRASTSAALDHAPTIADDHDLGAASVSHDPTPSATVTPALADIKLDASTVSHDAAKKQAGHWWSWGGKVDDSADKSESCSYEPVGRPNAEAGCKESVVRNDAQEEHASETGSPLQQGDSYFDHSGSLARLHPQRSCTHCNALIAARDLPSHEVNPEPSALNPKP